MDVDTSSYKNDPQPSMLDTVGKFGALQAQQQSIQRQGIGIESDKLKLANERLGVLAKEYTTLLADNDVMTGSPAATAKVQSMGQRMVNLGVIPANMFGEFAKSVPSDPKQIPQFISQQMARVQSIGEAIDYNLGQAGPEIGDNQVKQQTLRSPKLGFGGIQPAGPGVQQQVPVGQPVIGPNGQQVLEGPQNQPIQTVPAPRMNVAPLAPPDVRVGAPVAPKVQSQLPAGNPRGPVSREPTGPAVGQPVSFETNRLSHVKDYEEATATLQATRPLIQAYKLIDQFNPRVGPGTDQWNKLVATAKTWGIVPTQTKDDPTAIYQEINKKMMQFVQQMGAPSDKQQALQMESNPNLKTQILPALKKLTYDTIALQRGRAILPYMYSSADYGTKNYQEEKGRNTNLLSEEALMIDHMSDDKRDALLDEMRKKQNTTEGRKFKKTLEAMKLGSWDLQ